jgi:hypothetical protein
MTGITTRSIRRRQQRGVILLAIISLLTMFMLIGITYVVVSGHFKRAAITNSQARQFGVPPQKHLDNALYQLLRDTDHAGSAVRGHSLLQDKYGHFSMRARIIQATLDPASLSYPADQQILEIQVYLQDLPLPITGGANPPNTDSLPLLNLGALNGRIITFLDGVAKNISGRILKSSPLSNNANANYTLRILFPKSISNTIAPASFQNKILLINGRDFSGTGFGLVSSTTSGRHGQLSVEALLPNRSADTTTQFSTFRRGGANEGYDVPDYQNMAMAAQLSNPDPTNRELEYVIPSFHRPALINYWQKKSGGIEWMANRDKVLMRPMPWNHPNFTGSNPHWRLANGDQDVLNQNNQNALLYGPWDIDNDGDGHPDSVWVDMGFPIQTDSSGRQYKPLFAILGTDMDGRLNLNAHGNQMHYLANTTNTPVTLAGGGDSAEFPRGSGFGPAEINLIGLLGTDYKQLLMGVTSQTPGRYKSDFSPGLTAKPAISFNGIDYFSYFIFGHHPHNHVDRRGSSFQSMPDIHGELAHGINRSGNVVYEVSQTPATGPLAQAPTAAGRRNTIVDNPYELNMVNPQASDQLFTAHELEALLRSQDPDNPKIMTPGPDGQWGTAGVDDDNNGFVDDVTEAGYVGTDDILRRDGVSRLYKLTNAFNGNSVVNAANRRSVTSASFDPPVPAVQIPNRLRSAQTGYTYGSHASQLLAARMLKDLDVQAMLNGIDGEWGDKDIDDDGNGMTDDLSEAGYPGTDDVRPELQKIALNNLMSWTKGPDGRWGAAGNDDDNNGTPDDIFDAGYGDDTRSPLIAINIFDGLKMNVNRPFGNGVDDNGDGVVDNFIESASPERLWPKVFDNAYPFPHNAPVWFDHDNNGIAADADPNAFLARYHYARQLYVLMLLMNERDQIDFDRNGDVNDDYSGDGSGDEKEFHLAQWAANVVDFRDADSIMTPFEFDLNPFNGWDVDGIIGTADDAHVERALVWGTERPELLITESLVYHDRRTEDLITEIPLEMGATIANGDDDFDQRLLPRSGAFFELYNPWHSPGINPANVNNANNPIPGTGSWHPAEFYRNTKGVRLNQTSFYPGVDGKRSPVWRMIVIRGTDRHADPDHWDSNLRPDADHVERAIYFSRDDNAVEIPIGQGAGNGHEQYYSSKAVAPLLPGRYAVIGSSGHREVARRDNRPGKTYQSFIGRSANAIRGEDGELGNLDYANTRRFELTPDVDPTVTDQVRLRNNKNPDGYGDAVKRGPGANASPQLPPPIAIVIDFHKYDGVNKSHSLSLTEPIGGYPERVNAEPNPEDENELQLRDPDLPEYSADQPLDNKYVKDPAHNGDPDENAPELQRTATITNGTTPDYAVVHLQRLANPLQPYHATTNPYRTIDSHSIDVTAFNGVKNDSVVPNINSDPYRFNTHQRGDKNDVPQARNLWKHEPYNQKPLTPNDSHPVDDHIFDTTLRTTLGFLNTPYGVPALAPNIGEVNDTGHPFPWLQWNNRPFVSQFEMMMVPRSRSSRLLHDYSLIKPTSTPYRVPPNNGSDTAYDHLLNFFESELGKDSTNFHRLFDYTEVPSHYTGAQTFLNPLKFQGNGHGTDEMHPPFNRISNFRDPGRININTIFDPVVYNGLMGLTNGRRGPNYSQWIHSRRGYGNLGASQVSFDDNKPTFFSNPLRPSGSGDIVPLTGLERSDVDISLFRKDPNGSQPLFDSDYPDKPRNASRNPSFKYQSLQRLGNLVTGRSNVYGVWITVGYFEVEPAGTVDATRPDGYQLGAEVGIDRGQIKRHRAFYMIDRSISVAFEPGENHNVDNAVILRRYVD